MSAAGASASSRDRIATTLLVAGVLVVYAVRGGTYDIVPRQESGLAIWWLVGVSCALGLLPRARAGRIRMGPLVALLALAAWTAVSLSWTESDERTVAEVARVLHYAGLTLMVTLAVTRQTWRAAAAGVVLAAAATAGLGVASRLTPQLLPVDIAGTFGGGRLSYPLNYWNAVAAWGAMATVMLLGWSAHAERLAIRAACLAAVPVAALSVYLSYSRAGVAGVALGMAVAIALSRNRLLLAFNLAVTAAATWMAIAAVRAAPEVARGEGSDGAGGVLLALAAGAALCLLVAWLTWRFHADRRWRLPLRAARVATATAALALLIAGASVGPGLASTAWRSFHRPLVTTGGDPASRLTSLGGTRAEIWSSAAHAVRAEPLHGIGAGSFEFWWSRDGDEAEFARDAHSLYLEQFAELGAPGLLLVVTFVAGALVAALLGRRRVREDGDVGASAALVAAFVVFAAHAGIDWLWESTAVTVLALTAVVIAAAPLATSGPDRGRPWRFGVPAVAAVACLLQLPGLLSTSAIRQSQAAARAGEFDRALRQASDAVAVAPWSASPYAHRGLLEESAGSFRAARQDFLRAIVREPTNWRHRVLLARAEAELGHSTAAVRALRAAAELRPASPLFRRRP